ncbi:Bifunctional epoxide hydrolase 2 [Ceratobasidium sp. 414]|nr:Bifunctional epoxide hydrolase 2 [Ceratobasidium sp. 414]
MADTVKQVEKFIKFIYTSAKQIQAGELPSWEKKGVIEAWLADDTKSVNPALLTEKETDTVIAEIKAGVGFSAMLNYYRNAKVNFELDKNLPQEFRPDIPKLLVIPNADPAIPGFLSANEEKAPNIEVVRLEGLCGHWVQLEQPTEIEKIVGDWVDRMAAKGWAV